MNNAHFKHFLRGMCGIVVLFRIIVQRRCPLPPGARSGVFKSLLQYLRSIGTKFKQCLCSICYQIGAVFVTRSVEYLSKDLQSISRREMSIGVAEEVHQVRCETETPSVVMPTCLPISLSYQIFLLMFCWTQVPQNILSIFPISQYLYLIKYFFFMFLWTQVPINILSIFSGQPASQYLYLIKYFFLIFF